MFNFIPTFVWIYFSTYEGNPVPPSLNGFPNTDNYFKMAIPIVLSVTEYTKYYGFGQANDGIEWGCVLDDGYKV